MSFSRASSGTKAWSGRYRLFVQSARLGLDLLVLALVSPPAVAQPVRSIRVVGDGDYAPYLFRSDDGKLQGILKDEWEAWEKKSGISVEIHGVGWGHSL